MPAKTFYIETSVWGCLAPGQPQDRKRIVTRLLKLLNGTAGTCAISPVVVAEINLAPAREAAEIRRYMALVRPILCPITEDVEALAGAYVEAGVLPEHRESDALHVACATFYQLDYVVSWNHRHMTRPMKRLQYEAVNRLNGYLRSPLICNPVEAFDELRGG